MVNMALPYKNIDLKNLRNLLNTTANSRLVTLEECLIAKRKLLTVGEEYL